MILHGYEEVEHTADIALRVWGEDFQALLTQAAKGLYALMGIIPASSSCKETSFSILQAPPETILVDFLTELLYLAEEAGLILDNFSYDEGINMLAISAVGYKIFTQERFIKAVTFHNLTIEGTSAGFETTITFDV